eukprot:4142711-Pyramimonas_sp.AAC.1
MKPLAQEQLHNIQRGFIGGRKLVDNVYDFEGSLALWGVFNGEEGVDGATFDLKAALASAFHTWLFD